MASVIGCMTMKTPFPYLGLIVGLNMSRLSSWKDIFLKVVDKPQNGKLKLFRWDVV